MVGAVRSNYGQEICVEGDGMFLPCGEDVRLVIGNRADILLTPRKARKLARKLRRVADEVEARNEARR
jgi:hypothetical protein